MNTKEIMISIIKNELKDFKRFEVIEHFSELVSEESDILLLLDILRNDTSSVVRHEAAAQLLKIEQKQPHLLSNLKDIVIKELLHVVVNDYSLVAKHESVEALSYIGNVDVIEKFNELIEDNKTHPELLESIIIAKETIIYRSEKNIGASGLCKQIIADVSATSISFN